METAKAGTEIDGEVDGSVGDHSHGFYESAKP
jgi:hypothetical protein